MASMTEKRKREETVKSSEVRAKWSEIIERVRFHGVTVRVRHYGKTVARIVAETDGPSDGAA